MQRYFCILVDDELILFVILQGEEATEDQEGYEAEETQEEAEGEGGYQRPEQGNEQKDRAKKNGIRG